MIRRLLSLLLLGFLVVPPGAPAQANGPGSVYARQHYDEPYTVHHVCGLPVTNTGHTSGYRVIRNVVGSDGEAFLVDDRYRYRETWTNNANGRKVYVHGYGRFREIRSTHVKGDIWRTTSVEAGQPIVVKNAQGQVLLSEAGRIFRAMVLDTHGDHTPETTDVLRVHVLAIQGHFPTSAPGFDFCRFVRRVVG